jgi:hypothetical protein
MPGARWNDPREYGGRDRGNDRPRVPGSGTATITTLWYTTSIYHAATASSWSVAFA